VITQTIAYPPAGTAIRHPELIRQQGARLRHRLPCDCRKGSSRKTRLNKTFQLPGYRLVSDFITGGGKPRVDNRCTERTERSYGICPARVKGLVKACGLVIRMAFFFNPFCGKPPQAISRNNSNGQTTTTDTLVTVLPTLHQPAVLDLKWGSSNLTRFIDGAKPKNG
jgi:hypothetical protein